MATVLLKQKYRKSWPIPKAGFEYDSAFSFFAIPFLYTMNYWLLIIIPVTSAFIGWIANRIAIKLLFHPRKPRKILGITLQGIIPGRQQQIAQKLGKLAIAGFQSFNMEQKFSNPENLKKVMPIIEEHIDDFLRNKLAREMPVIGMFIGDKTIVTLKETFMKELELIFPQVMKQYASNLKNDLDIEQIIIKKVAEIPSDKVEKIFNQALYKELRIAGILGAFIGFIIGWVQVIIIFLST